MGGDKPSTAGRRKGIENEDPFLARDSTARDGRASSPYSIATASPKVWLFSIALNGPAFATTTYLSMLAFATGPERPACRDCTYKQAHEAGPASAVWAVVRTRRLWERASTV